MIRDYQQAVDFLYGNLPMFQRVGAAALKNDLSNTIRLCDALNNPQKEFRSVHIAGTNGKGSTAHMLASVFQSCGYKTGLYTSPHLKSFTERIKVNGVEVDKGYVVEFINRMRATIDSVKPSFFEMTVAMAFDFFRRERVDVAVIETGLGGRLDSTNVILPLVSIITNIGTDHAELLGDTIEKIAFEKAGIIKPHVPVVISERQPEATAIFEKVATEKQAPLIFAEDRYEIRPRGDRLLVVTGEPEHETIVDLPLKGIYQRKNLAGVLAAIDVLREHFTLPRARVIDGLENVIGQTGLKGRWQVLRTNPLLICDTGHNVEGLAYVAEQIKSVPHDKLFMILGMNQEKDVEKILSLLPRDARYLFCQAKIPRAMEASKLASRAQAFGVDGKVVPDVNDAIRWALANAGGGDLVFVGGSTFVVAEIDGL